ncbi:MAG: ABC transporter ATP-binding protein [candidate division FCPU426 bacterium]
MSEPVLRLEQVEKTFGQGSGLVPVLRGVELGVAPGEMVAIVGPSGAGKTTLLSVAGGLMHPTGGSVRILGQDLYSLGDEGLAALRNKSVGFVFQLHYLLPEFNAEENVMLPALIAGLSHAEARKQAAEWLERVGLTHRRTHRPGELSGGEQQRVAIARALVNRPALLLADEPTGDLDLATAQGIHDLFMNLNREAGQTVIVVTHNPALANLANRTITLQDGRVVAENGGTVSKPSGSSA